MKLRFSIRTLLAVMVVVGVGSVVGTNWWTRPYDVVELIPETGYVTYQVRRNLNGGAVHVGPVRFLGSDFDFFIGQEYVPFVERNGNLSDKGKWLLEKLEIEYPPQRY